VPELSARSVVREILTSDIMMSADGVMDRAKKRGVKLPDPELRRLVTKTRSWMKSQPKDTAAPATVPAAARHIVAPTPEPKVEPVVELTNHMNLSSVFANVTRVNSVVSACGSVDVARDVAEAVRACGSVAAFLQHLEVVAGIRRSDKM
jgi:urease gamma subunit